MGQGANSPANSRLLPLPSGLAELPSEIVRHPRASTPLGPAANQGEAPRRSDYLSPRRQINAPLIKKYVPSQFKGHVSLVALEVCHIPFNAAPFPLPSPRLHPVSASSPVGIQRGSK